MDAIPTLPPLPEVLRVSICKLAVKVEPQADGSVVLTRLPDLKKVRVSFYSKVPSGPRYTDF